MRAGGSESPVVNQHPYREDGPGECHAERDDPDDGSERAMVGEQVRGPVRDGVDHAGMCESAERDQPQGRNGGNCRCPQEHRAAACSS